MWKVEGIDPVSSVLNTEQGVIIIIKLTSDLFVSQDNKVTGIAYNAPVVVVVTHSYVLSSTVVNASITVNETQQITSSVADNSVSVSNPTFTYSSNAPTNATVTSTGLITAIAIGSANITISFTGLDCVVYTKTIAITAITAVARTFTLVGSSSLSLNVPLVNQTYTVIDGATGLAVTDLAFTYTLSNASLVTIVSSTSNTVTLKGVASGQEKLSAINSTYAPFKIVNVASGF